MLLTQLASNIMGSSILAAICDATTQGIEHASRVQRLKVVRKPLKNPKGFEPADNASDREMRFQLDFGRLQRFTISFGVWGALPSFAFYQYALPWMVPGSTFQDIVLKVILDNSILNVLLPSTMLAANAYQEGGLQCILRRMRQDLLPVLGLYISVYIPVDFLMFTVIPIPLQVLFVKTVNVFIQIITSSIVNRQLKDDAGTGKTGTAMSEPEVTKGN